VPTTLPATTSTETGDARERAARGWFGYGQWNAPYWFVGMEPGGTDDIAWYETWLRLGGTELCDCRDHHLGTSFSKWHVGSRPPVQWTWRRLIQLLLGYEGRPADLDSVSAYQRDKWGALTGDTALAEVSAIRARSIATKLDRTTNLDQRVSILQERLAANEPNFAVFYGTTFRNIYERIAQVKFDAKGYGWSGATLCVLVVHPAARSISSEVKSGDWWIRKGAEIRTIIAQKKPVQGCVTVTAKTVPQSVAPDPARRYSSRPPRPKKAIGSFEPEPSDVIRLLVEDNPKLAASKSYRRFESYRDGMTVGEYKAAVFERLGKTEARKCKVDVKWDSDRNFIQLIRGGQPIDLSIPVWLRRA